MIEVNLKHDVEFSKAAGMAVVLGAAIGASIVVTKESIEYGKRKINKIMNRKNKSTLEAK